ncbi:MAG TPA: DoxX family protein [Anaeromyxobacter sp.]|nr:DoxX family protein [Anaeromyxobacter sp.]
MSTDVLDRSYARDVPGARGALRWLAPLGRVLFALIFVSSGLSHFSRQSIDYAASQGVPAAQVFVPLAGVLALVGGLGVALGFRTRLAALLLVIFLVPVTLEMHAFWTAQDPMAAMNQQIHFMKNLSMLGAALYFLCMGGGPVSLDARRHRPAVAAPPAEVR